MTVTYMREETTDVADGYLICCEIDGLPFCFSFGTETSEADAVLTCASALAARGYADVMLVAA